MLEATRRRLVAAGVVLLAVLLALALCLAAVVIAGTTNNAEAQTAGVQVSSFPGATVTLDATKTTVTRELVTYCPEGFEAISGGWSASPGPWQITASFPSARPSIYGPGAWTLVVTMTKSKTPIDFTPYVVCLGGTSQLPG